MKITAMSIEWMKRYSNRPYLVVTTAEVPPSLSEYKFQQKGSLYWAEKDGFVEFFSYTVPGSGYGGTLFHLNMEDGGHRILVGPWSSGAYVMNEYFAPCVDCVLYHPAGQNHGHVLVSAVELAMAELLPDYELELDETTYVPTLKGHTWEESKLLVP